MSFPRSNGHPAEQVQVQLTVYPDWTSLNNSYLSRTSGSKRSYFQCNRFRGDGSVISHYDIQENEIVWCLAKDLISSSIASSSFHTSNTSKMVKVRSSFNNYFFPREIQILIDYLASKFDSYNEKYIAEICASVIQPVGFLKSPYRFLPDTRGKTDYPFEADYGGIIPAYVRKPGDMLKIESRARIAVPTPGLWNDPQFYKDKQHVPGKITMFIETETPEKNKERFESIFTGFFANDSMRVETMLKDINDSGHKGVQALSDIPNSFLDLVSTVAIDTLQRGLVNRDFQLVNRFKYNYMITAFNRIYDIIGNKEMSFKILIFMVINEVKEPSYIKACLTLFSLAYHLGIRQTLSIDEIAREILNSNTAINPELIDYFENTTVKNLRNNENNFKLYELPVIGDETLCDFNTSNGLSENDWLRKISEEGDMALNWTDILYYTDTDKSPLKSKHVKAANATSIKMFGDTSPHKSDTPNDFEIQEISLKDNAAQRQREALNFTIIAHQIFNLTIPTDTMTTSGNTLEAEGHLHRHAKDPRVRPMIQESCNRAHRFSLEICRNILSELLPTELRERYRIGFDPQTNQNYAMVVDSSHHHVFNKKSLVGVVAENMSQTFSNFSQSLCEWLYQENTKLVMTTIEPQTQGGRAVAYIK